MNVFRDIEIGKIEVRTIRFDRKIIAPFTVIILPDSVRINDYNYSNHDVRSFFYNNFVDISLSNPENQNKIKIQDGIYFWRNIDIYEFLEYFYQTNNITQEWDFLYDGRNNFSNNLYLLRNTSYSAVFVQESVFDIANLAEYIEIAHYMGCNFYFDTGLGKNIQWVEQQIQVAKSFLDGYEKKFIFFAINMPFNTKQTVQVNIPLDTMNVFITAGYTSIYSPIRYEREYRNSLGDINTIRPYDVVAYLPISSLYAVMIMNKYETETAYKPIINKVVSVVTYGVDKVYSKDEIDFMKNKSINAPYLKNSIITFLSDVTTLYRYNPTSVLAHENIMRLSLDIARELTYLLMPIVGENKKDEEISSIIQSVRNYISNNILYMSDVNPSDLEITFNRTNDNKIKIDIVYKAPKTIEKINLVTIYF